jgi:hypothetical protein
MKRKVLIVVTSDPRTSHRTAEALRIAAGAGTWEKADISVYLRGEAVRAVGEPAGDLVDEEDYGRYWPMLAEAKQTVYVEAGAANLPGAKNSPVSYREISDAEFAQLAAEQNCVMRF